MLENPAAAPTPAPEAAVDYLHTRCLIAMFYLVAVVWAVRNVNHNETSALDLLVPISLALSLGWWAIVDARRRRHPIPLLARPWVVLFAGLVVPAYIVWSRRWSGAGWVVLHGVLWQLLATLSMHVGGLMIYGQEWLRGLGF